MPDNNPERSQPPVRCKALLLCDRVIVEAGTGKPSIIGVFETLNVRTLPDPTEEVAIFVQLNNGLGVTN